MKKKLLIFVTVFVLVFSICIPAFAAPVQNNTNPPSTSSSGVAGESLASKDVSADKFVYDNANLLTDAEEAEVAAILQGVYDNQQFGAYVLTVNSLGGVAPVVYADDYYDYNNLGYGAGHDGCVLVIAVESRDWYISTRGYGITALTDAGIDYIGDDIVRYLKNDDWAGGIKQYASDVDQFVNEAKTNKPYDTGHMPRAHKNAVDYLKGIAISLVISLIIAFVVVSKVKSNYKPVKFSKNAAYYLADGSLRVSGSYDNYITSSVSKVAIESKSSGGGSSTHTSSSGASHGGGGGKF